MSLVGGGGGLAGIFGIFKAIVGSKPTVAEQEKAEDVLDSPPESQEALRLSRRAIDAVVKTNERLNETTERVDKVERENSELRIAIITLTNDRQVLIEYAMNIHGDWEVLRMKDTALPLPKISIPYPRGSNGNSPDS